jgi:hypothetical protein
LSSQLVELPDEIVAESIPFRLLQGHVQSLTVEYESKRLELDRVSKEADAMREMQESFREMVFVRHILSDAGGRELTMGYRKRLENRSRRCKSDWSSRRVI